jgi:uncharacterized protein with PQ loop repeat
MVRGGSVLHHIHKRKKLHQDHNLEPYPHPKRFVRWLDLTIFFLAFAGPLANLPQIIQIFTEKTAAGLSFTTWLIFVIIAVPWIAYGIVHKEKPIIIANILWFITQLFVVIGIVMYG